MRAIFHPDSIEFESYPFAPASVASGKRLPHALIRDVDVSAAPPEIRTLQGETLFVSAEQREEFQAAMRAAGIAEVRRYDVWADLLEPYLDTEFTLQEQRETLARLNECGCVETEVNQIRRRVERPMLTYNFALWEWVHLGLFDVLLAMRPRLTLAAWIDPRVKRFERFYRDAMFIAEHGRRKQEATRTSHE